MTTFPSWSSVLTWPWLIPWILLYLHISDQRQEFKKIHCCTKAHRGWPHHTAWLAYHPQKNGESEKLFLPRVPHVPPWSSGRWPNMVCGWHRHYLSIYPILVVSNNSRVMTVTCKAHVGLLLIEAWDRYKQREQSKTVTEFYPLLFLPILTKAGSLSAWDYKLQKHRNIRGGLALASHTPCVLCGRALEK